MTYYSKIDGWLLGLMAIILLSNLILLIYCWLNAPANAGMILSLALLLVVGVEGFSAWLLSSTGYTISGNDLTIRSGPFYWNVPIDTITQVKATRNPLSAPALSLDRLEISYGSQRKILVSPQDKAEFLQAIGQTLSL